MPAGTPVQSVPGPGELPQTFETAADLEARAGAGTRIAAVDARPQTLAADDEYVWVPRRPVTVRPGDAVARHLRRPLPPGTSGVAGRRDELRTVTNTDAAARPGWTRLDLDEPVVDPPTTPWPPAGTPTSTCTRSAHGCGCSAGTRRTRPCSS